MAYTIALAGKGGTGKTTITAFLIQHLLKKGCGSILAIDADPNSNLNQALGVELTDTVVGILEKLSALKGDMPSGMTKNTYIEYEVQKTITEAEGFDLLAMGRPEGPGCYCYVNSVLRGLIEKLSKAYDYEVIDNEAGMEHLSRRINRAIDTLFLVSDNSRIGIRSAKRISDLTKEMDIKVATEYLVVNMAGSNIAPLKDEIDKSGLTFAGAVPFDENIERKSLEGKSLLGDLHNFKAWKVFAEIISQKGIGVKIRR